MLADPSCALLDSTVVRWKCGAGGGGGMTYYNTVVRPNQRCFCKEYQLFVCSRATITFGRHHDLSGVGVETTTIST